MQKSKSLVFKVKRGPPELIPPAAPTPNEMKELSSIDAQEGLRFHVPVIFIYRNNNNINEHDDPAKVIKEALGKALVPYYPLAGRLRERSAGKLVVDCNGEGVLFVEAHAHDVTLDDFGEELHPPFPCYEELHPCLPHGYNDGILHSPLLFFQVTKLKCGGFIIVVKFNHTMIDGIGLSDFTKLMMELIHGPQQRCPKPIWERHLLCARQPPRVTCVHHEYESDSMVSPDTTAIPVIHKSFFLGAREISALRCFIPPELKSSATTFEVLTACLWRCRTIALEPHPDELVRYLCVVNARSIYNPPLPKGYYGNAVAFPTAVTTAGELCRRPVRYALELVKKAKGEVTDEYVRSVADLIQVNNGRPRLNVESLSFMVSNHMYIGFDRLDFGWGPPVYGGATGELEGLGTFYVPYKNKKGERGIVFPIKLPVLAMERFVNELSLMLSQFHPQSSAPKISSSL